MLMPERWRSAHTAGLERFNATGEAPLLGLTLDVEGLRADGTEFPLELTIALVPDDDPEQVLFTGIVRDVTERRQAEHALAHQTALLREQARFFDLAFAAILFRQRDTGTIRFWNRAAEELYGWSKAEAIGQPAHTLLATRFSEPQETIECALDQHGRWEGDLTVTTRGGEERVVRSRWAVQRDAAGRSSGVLELHTDVTARRRVEAERAELLAAAQEYSRRLAELSVLKADFTAMVAHELGGPVAAIRGLAGVLAVGGLDLQQAELVATIQAEAELLQTLVTDIRHAALDERTDFTVVPRPVPLAALLDEALSHARSLPGDHPLQLHASAVGQVMADPERIGQVLRNLLGNAAKHTPPRTPIALRAVPAGSRVRLEVADLGPGIPPDDLARIFEKFGRGRDARGRRVHGVGLGLYIARRIVQAHGSELTVASAPGVGTVFAFELEGVP
jgi:PAS domain S-box-containing protein